MKKLLSVALILIAAASFGQVITLTQTNPSYQQPNNWPQQNSWMMLAAPYNDFVSLNNSAASLAGNNTFSGTNNFTGATTFSNRKSNVISDSVKNPITLTSNQSGSIVILKSISGDTLVLPSATISNVGSTYVVIIGYSVTSNLHVIKTAGSDVFYGTAFLTSTTTASPFLSTASKTLGLTTTTTGGLAGGRIELTCMTGGRWAITAILYGSGTVANPFQ